MTAAGHSALHGPGWLSTALAVVRLGRPKFLLGGVALYGLGALAARAAGHVFAPAAFCWGQLAVSSIQLMTHYSNDYFDYEADCANHTPTQFSGGSRVLVRKELPRSAALWAALVMAALACLATVALIVSNDQRSWALPVAVLGAMLLLSWSYSSPPLSLHTRGLGEPTVATVVPLLTPISGFVIQSGEFDWSIVVLSAPLCLLMTAALLTFEFSDEAGDRAVGKRSWVVLLGARRVAQLCSASMLAGFLVSFAGFFFGEPAVIAETWVFLLPLVVIQIARMLRGDWRRSEAWGTLTLGAAALFFLAVLVDLVALARLL